MGDVLIGEIEKGYGLSPTAFVLQMRNLRKKTEERANRFIAEMLSLFSALQFRVMRLAPL